MKTYKFDCGCEFPIVNDAIKEDGLPHIKLDIDNIRFDCPKTLQIFIDGKTKGVFQLEKALGKQWSKAVKPINIEEISALISIIRPGCLKAKVGGKSMTKHFVDRKDGAEDFEYFHPDAEEILKDSYDVIIYQEQALALAKKFAGFSLEQADSLRRAVGKKDSELMQQVRKEFIEGCKNTAIISEEQGISLFDIIEKSNRYSFNKSHAISYAITSYQCAYIKAHFPLQFYCVWLSMAEEKIDPQTEISELINDAKSNGVKIFGPSLFKKNANFQIFDNAIYFGISNIKDIGEKTIINIFDTIKSAEELLGKSISDMSWPELLFNVLLKIGKTSASNIICAGAVSNFNMHRNQMLYEYNKILKLSKCEMLNFLGYTHDSTLLRLEQLLIDKIPRGKRVEVVQSIIKSLKEPPNELVDELRWIVNVESDLLGIPVSCSKLDDVDKSMINCRCAEFDMTNIRSLIFGVKIDRATEWIPPGTESPMCFITLSDDTGSVEGFLNVDDYIENKSLIFQDNVVLVTGFKNKKGNLTIKKVSQL